MAFPVEPIPGEAKLFRRIHRNHLTPEGVISSQAFKEEHLSVNWEKYSDAPATAIDSSAVVALLVADQCRRLGQRVEHTPIEPDQPFGPNRAHAEVVGSKDRTIRHQLRDLAKVVWRREGKTLAPG